MRLHPPLALISLSVALSLEAGAWAQGTAPSQITPPTSRPLPRVATDTVQIPAVADRLAPPGSETLFVTPGAFVVAAESPELLKLADGFALPPVGTRLSVAALFAIAAGWEQAFARAGYPLVRVALPAQSVLDGGTVRFTVVDGFIESVDVQALPAAVREVVQQRLQPLVGKRRLAQAELERRVLLAGDVPGLSLRSTLAPGDAPAGTKLILDGRHARVSGSFSADNRLGATLKHWQFGPTVAVNSGLGLGEQIYATMRSGERVRDSLGGDPLLRILATGVTLPIGSDGASTTVELTDSRTHAVAAPGTVDTLGQLRRITLRGSYPVLLGRSESLSLGLVLEHVAQASRAPLFGVDVSDDRYTVLRGTVDGAIALPSGSQMSAALTLSGGLGGRNPDDAAQTGVPLSRQGAEPIFRKLGAIARVKQPLPAEGLRIDLSLAGQTGFGHALLQSEQFSLEGTYLVSGVPSGALSVDSGAALRAELQRSVALAWGGPRSVFTPYGFVAYGRGRVERPTSVESPSVVGRSHGLGLRGEVAGGSSGLIHSLTLEWARQYSEGANLPVGQRGTFIYGLSF